MDYLLALLQGLGIAAAIGIRPFLPTLLVGALAAGDLGIDFGGTDFVFLEQTAFLLVIVIAVAVFNIVDRRRGADTRGQGAAVMLLLACALVLGALTASGSIADVSADWWPGVPVGVAAASLGFLAARSLFGRVSARLDADTAKALPLYAEGTALLGAGLSVLFPPLAILLVAGLAWLLIGGRRREGEKYAGLRILQVKKLVLAVIDAMKPAMLERAVATGRAPALQLLMERGHYVDECVAAFPSVTPVCAASIATGTGPGEHDISAMNWWHRGEERYVEYGTSFGASRAFGIRQSLTDTIYNMNLEHLSKNIETVFERLDDADIRTAGTTYLMYRGRHRHEPSVDTALSRLAHTAFGLPTMGPRELFYADMFASRKTSCRSQLGLPGVRDQHSGCVSSYMVEHDLFDFLLLSLPDNDTHSHKYGPFAQVDSIAAADRQIARVMEAAGGPDKFLEDHAFIVCSDHSQSKVEGEIDLFKAFDGFGLRAAQRSRADDEIAVCPNSRAAQVYVLDRDKRRSLIPRVERTLLALEGVDLVMRMGDHPDGEAVVRGERSRGVKELRFAPRGDLLDARGGRWSVEGDLDLLGLKIEDDQIRSTTYPDAMSRVWSALRCHSAGEVLASARPGYEFLDWGGAHHVGGGSHGSLHANDSNAVLIWTGTGPEKSAKEQWALRDIVPMITQHFGLN